MKNNFPVYRFPFDQYRKASVSLLQEREAAKKEKEKWQRGRDRLSSEQQQLLDQEFKKTFELFQKFFYRLSEFGGAEILLEDLRLLVAQGARAGLLDPYELGGFNTAGIIKEIIDLRTEQEFAVATEAVRLSLIAGADMVRLKAYVGNGGAPSLYWLCEYLSGGIRKESLHLKDKAQYLCCFRIFCLVVAYTPEATQCENYCATYLSRFQPDQEVQMLQKEIFLRLICSGLVKSNPNHYASMFSRLTSLIKHELLEWLPILFPYEETELDTYINFLLDHLKDLNAGTLLNSFKATREGRKYFNGYFSPKKHWLLSYLVQNHGDSIFGLVRGHELEMLEPFLKNYKKELTDLRDKKGNTLLHMAVLSGTSSEKIASRLTAIGISAKIPNNEGETAEDIVKRKK